MVQPFILISILVFALTVVGALIVAAIAMQKSNVDSIQSDRELHPRGYCIGLCISIGVGFGVALGLVFDNLALGIAIGVATGICIGGVLEQKNKGKFHPLSEQEQKLQKWVVALGLLMLLLFKSNRLAIKPACSASAKLKDFNALNPAKSAIATSFGLGDIRARKLFSFQ